MIAGQECTRGCRFCAVGTIKTPPPLDVNEPEQLADAVDSMNLRHVVITVVNRDDLPDSGADHYKRCIEAVHRRQPELTLELLCSDLEEIIMHLPTFWRGAPCQSLLTMLNVYLA
jgi:lipoic acid synthetase